MKYPGAIVLAVCVVVLLGGASGAQQKKPSPDGHAGAEVGGRYVGAQPVYVGGKWIEVSYGRPLKRGRELWGSGDEFGRMLKAGAPVWRAGADNSTYLMTQIPIVIDGRRIEPGGYTMFIELRPDDWTLIVSNWQPQRFYDPNNREQLWGAFRYTPDRDVLRTRMRLATLPFSMEQLTWAFLDMSETAGTLAMMWDRQMATVPFAVAN